jgi:hypothetical protein
VKRLFCVRAVAVNDGNERAEETLGVLRYCILRAVYLAGMVRVEIDVLGGWCGQRRWLVSGSKVAAREEVYGSTEVCALVVDGRPDWYTKECLITGRQVRQWC